MESNLKSFEKRLKVLEDKLSSNGALDVPKKEKVPRKSSDYNNFMKEYISEQKSKGTTKSHKDLFADGAKAWSSKKELIK